MQETVVMVVGTAVGMFQTGLWSATTRLCGGTSLAIPRRKEIAGEARRLSKGASLDEASETVLRVPKSIPISLPSDLAQLA